MVAEQQRKITTMYYW